MIFNNQYSVNMLADSIKSLKAQYSANRRMMVQMMLDYYDGDNTIQYISDKFNINNFREVPPLSFNLTKRLIDKMSRAYQFKPNRNHINRPMAQLLKNKQVTYRKYEGKIHNN